MFSASLAVRSRNALRSLNTSQTTSGARKPSTRPPRWAPIAHSFSSSGRIGGCAGRYPGGGAWPNPWGGGGPGGRCGSYGGCGDSGPVLMDRLKQSGAARRLTRTGGCSDGGRDEVDELLDAAEQARLEVGVRAHPAEDVLP